MQFQSLKIGCKPYFEFNYNFKFTIKPITDEVELWCGHVYCDGIRECNCGQPSSIRCHDSNVNSSTMGQFQVR